jgi:parallel beta-helix repeat protein
MTIFVPDNFTTIQGAIDSAAPGDTIRIRNRTYYENIYINKTIALLGEDPKATIINGNKTNAAWAPVVEILGTGAKNVKICNFTLEGSNSSWGIYISLHANAWIEKTIVADNSGGIVADFSKGNTFINNTVIDNAFEGIEFVDSDENTMRNNTMEGNQYNFGILASSFNNSIDTSNLINGKPIQYLKNQNDLTIAQNMGYLALINCTRIKVENLTLQDNYNGLLLVGTRDSTVRRNSFDNNSRGLDIINSSNNTIETNNITDNLWLGVALDHSPHNRFRENTLTRNEFNLRVNGDSLGDFLQDIDTSNTMNGKATRYLVNYTDSTINPSVLNNTGYLAFVNCRNAAVGDLLLEHDELLVAFTQNCSIVGTRIANGGVSLAYSSSVDLTGNTIVNGESGISIYHSDNNTLTGNNVTENRENGLQFQTSSNNTVFDNNIERNMIGISLTDSSSNNTVSANNITDNKYYGINLWNSSYNLFFHNNMINHVRWQVTGSYSSSNKWDDGYPSGGNYWSDYNGTDVHSGPKQNLTGADGIGDTRYTGFFMMPSQWVLDRYPLIQPFRTFVAGVWERKARNIDIISNSTLSDFRLDISAKRISFNITGDKGTAGFCRITVPNIIVQTLWAANYKVTIDGHPQPFRNWTDAQDTYVYVNYTHSKHEIVIVAEFPESAISAALAIITACVAIIVRKSNKNKTLKP